MKKLDPNFPPLRERGHLAAELSLILRESYGERSSAMKRIAAELKISERTVKNWYAGRNGPRGDHLINLMTRNDKIFVMVLALCGRPPTAPTDAIVLACSYLEQARDCLIKLEKLQPK